MNSSNQNAISLPLEILLLVCIAVLFFFIAFHAIKYFRRQLVIKYGIKYNAVLELNDITEFQNIKKKKVNKDCSSKKDYEKTEPLDFFEACIYEDSTWVNERIQKIRYNEVANEEYCSRFDYVMRLTPEKCPEKYLNYFPYFEKWSNLYRHKWFRSLETEMAEEEKKAPILDPAIEAVVKYTSPAGRNNYKKSVQISLHDCLNALESLEKKENYRKSKKYQRTLMTDSLRYDVMKRDGFQCQLCGARRQDGAILHVDHIIPVAKGGKTEMSNLRTLCDRCNLGKSDKYDAAGDN